MAIKLIVIDITHNNWSHGAMIKVAFCTEYENGSTYSSIDSFVFNCLFYGFCNEYNSMTHIKIKSNVYY